MPSAPKPVYAFGPFSLETTRRLLVRNGEVVPLTSKAFETLLALVQNARNILAKDDLLRRVWPDMVVEESNLQLLRPDERRPRKPDGRREQCQPI